MIGDSGGLVDFPTGWTMVRLSDIVSINPSLTAHLDDDLEVSFVPMKAVEAMSGRVDLSETRRAREVRKGYTSFYSGDVLWAKITPCMENGKVAVIRNLKNDVGFGSTEFHVLRPFARGVTAEWLFFFLTQQSVRQDARKHMTGSAGQLRVPTAYLADLIVPLPPRVEQRAIVVKIEALFSELDKGIEQLQTIKQQLKQYRQAVLKAAFEGKLTAAWRAERQAAGTRLTADELLERIRRERGLRDVPRFRPAQDGIPQEWAWVRLGALGDLARGKSRHRPRNAPHLYGGPYPFIQTGDVKAANRIIRSFTQTYSEEGLEQSRMWPAGTLCITIAANIAETAFLGFHGCFPDSIVGFTACEPLIHPEYVHFFFESAKYRIAAYAPSTLPRLRRTSTCRRLRT